MRIKKGDTVLIKSPTKQNPSRLIEAYVRYASSEGRLSLVGANRRIIYLYEDSPKIVCKLDASEETDGGTAVLLEKVKR